MATSTEELRVKLLDAKKAEVELRSVRKELEGTTSASTKGGKASEEAAKGHGILSSAIGGLGKAALYAGSFVGIYGLAEGIKGVVEGGIKATEQHALLENALKATGNTGAGAYKQINQAIAQSTTHGGFGRSEETEGIAQLTRELGSYTVAIKANATAITLARGTHENYATALTQVQRLETGTPGRLTKLIGPYVAVKTYVDELTASQKKRFPAMVKEAELKDKEATALQINQKLQEKYGTAVKAYNDTAAGAIANANNAFKNAEDELGEKLAPTIATVAKAFGEVVTELTKGEGVWKTVDQDAKVFGETLGEVWRYFEKNKTALKGLEVGLGVLASAWSVEKVLSFYSALKKLEIVGLISKLLGTGGLGAAGEEAGTGLAAGLAALGPEVLAAAAAVAGIYEAVKHAEEIRHFFGLGGTTTHYVGPHGQPSTKQRVEQEAVQGYLSNRGLFAREVHEQQTHHEAASPAELQAIKVELHLDSTKAAEAIFRNPRASRMISEATTAHVLKKKARE